MTEWKIIGAKSQGTSHLYTNTPCQDYYKTGCIQSSLYCFVSDGAGSAQYGMEGAEISCETALEHIQTLLINPDYEINEADLINVAETIHDKLNQKAIELKCQARDLACTFLGVVITNNYAGYIQIGDGSIVVKYSDIYSNYQVLFWPQAGEYANMTFFITEESYLANINCKCLDDIPTEIAVFTDGIQRLALLFDSKEVHIPFFEPMFNILNKTEDALELNTLNKKLETFLESNAINQSTDDDKTLVLISRKNNELEQ